MRLRYSKNCSGTMLGLRVLQCGGVNVKSCCVNKALAWMSPALNLIQQSATISPRQTTCITTCSKLVPVCSYENIDTDEAFSWLYAATG